MGKAPTRRPQFQPVMSVWGSSCSGRHGKWETVCPADTRGGRAPSARTPVLPVQGEITLIESDFSKPLSHQEGGNLNLLLSQQRLWGAQKPRVRVFHRRCSQGHLKALAQMPWCKESLKSPARLGFDLPRCTVCPLTSEGLPPTLLGPP